MFKINYEFRVETYRSCTAPVNDSEGPVTNQVLAPVLVVSYRLHPVLGS